MVEIASALSAHKEILILDEAFALLDYKNKILVVNILKDLQKTVVFNTSHNLEDVILLGGSVYILRPDTHEFLAYSGEMTVEGIRKYYIGRDQADGGYRV